MRRRKNLDQHLQRRGDFWTYYRRVPRDLKDLDARFPVIRTALGTYDLAEARHKRDLLQAADDALWAAFRAEGTSTQSTAIHHAAVARARSFGFQYKSAQELSATATWPELSERLEVISAHRDEPNVATALLGVVEAPRARFGDALDMFIKDFNREKLSKMSKSQFKKWKDIPNRAIADFIEVVGDKPLDEITREDARVFHQYWQDKIVPAVPGQKALTASYGNRQIGELRKLYRVYFDRVHNTPDRPNPFGRLNFKTGKQKSRATFEEGWICDKFLSGDFLSGLNVQARGIMLAMVETGCRPSEICNLDERCIRLEGPTPHLVIRPRSLAQIMEEDPDFDPVDFEPRILKTDDSERRLPLVGISLEVFKRFRKGFHQYFEGEVAASAAINKYLKENRLRPTAKHTLYSIRHSFEDRLLRANVSDDLRRHFMGHKVKRPPYGEQGGLRWQHDLFSAWALPFDPTILNQE